MTEHLRPWTTRQHGVVAAWQLRAAGWSAKQIHHRLGGLRRVHDGVAVTGDAPFTLEQLRWAAVLTAPARYLSHASAAAACEFWREPAWVTVTQRGSGGPRRHGHLVVHRSRCLDGHVGTRSGLPMTSPARTLIDLEPHLSAAQLDRAVREALRVGAVSCAELQEALARSPRRKRPRRLAALAAEFAPLPIRRTRSGAESQAVAVLARAERPAPRVNERIAGFEADLSWPARRLIIELDGVEFHQFPQRDEECTAAWSAAWWEVRRLPANVPADQPARLLAAYDLPTRFERGV